MSAFLLPAVSGAGWEAGLQIHLMLASVHNRLVDQESTHVAFPTDHLFAVEFARERLQTGFDNPAAEAEDQVEG